MNNVDINIPDPSFGGNINAFILDLEKVRDKKLYGELPAHIFFQLKDIFQRMETLGSVRLEGNVTTLDEYVEEIIEKKPPENERQKELDNIEKAIEFIELNTDTDTKIDRAYISEIHKIVVKDLTPPPPNENEGSKYPGELRPHNVQIKKSKHVPPDYAVLPDYFQEFIKFINIEYSLQYQLLMASIANHRFAYIHPFDNGNGRTGRLLNYALLIKLGFQVKRGRIINPSSIFYSDRDKYNVMLSEADSLTDTGILNWAEYFLSGLKNEIEKIDKLLDIKFVREKILIPAIKFSLERKQITPRESEILIYLLSKEDMKMKTEDLSNIGIEVSTIQRTRIMNILKTKNIIHPVFGKTRIYTISFANTYLLRGVVHFLKKEGFVSDFLNQN